MYSDYAASFIGATGDEISEETEQALMALFGDCSKPLTHRAPITVAAEPPKTAQIPDTNISYFMNNIVEQIDNHQDQYYSIANFNNQVSEITNNNTINNAFSVYSPGVSFFENLLSDNIFVNSISIDGTKYCFEDMTVLTDASLGYSFNSTTCALTLTLTLTSSAVKSLVTCP